MNSVMVADGLTKTFGPHRGVTDLGFEVQRGEVFGFLGPNGAGKSTTIRMFLGLVRPTAGHAVLFGQDVEHAPTSILARVGYLPGELALHPRLTGSQHIEFAARVRGLEDRAMLDQLVERFGVIVDRPVRTLSKGYRQKIGIVLAFMHDPELLVLDEPTSGLDPLMQDEFQRLVREKVAEGKSVFLSSHELDEVQRVVDRVAIIKDGALVVIDTVEGLRRSAPRTIEFRFARDADAERFRELPEVRVVNVEAKRITLVLHGPVAPVLRVALDFEPIDVVARPADLDELFLTYYRPQGAEIGDGAR
ncbi:MAG TPA: ABC transporter ATP-binding protein [Acidimicrobiales bacterium]|nr:ABC transporter ATP-binding protein [Acidimicrobiales bacterium]